MDGLIALQTAEMLDAVKTVLFSGLFVFGIGLWVHATYFREED